MENIGAGSLMINILLIGNGAREHAIARAIKKSPQKTALYYCGANQNPGIDLLCDQYLEANLINHAAIINFALTHQINFAIIGPEAPLANGLVDDLNAAHIKCIGPTKILAQIESSKGFARDLMAEYNIVGAPEYKRFEKYTEADINNYIAHLNNHYVIKDDGLCGGKGVKVSGEHLKSITDALQFCKEIQHAFVIEEKLIGPEFSLISFTDGKTTLHFPPVQDHKRAYENDLGPNTGGMGSYTCENHLLPFLSLSHVKTAENINTDIIAALKQKTGEDYIGFIYGGFMLTRSGVKVIEFNARLGDPEAINLLSLLKTDFVALCLLALNQKLSDIKLICEQKATVVKYIVPNGYPEKSIEAEINVDLKNSAHYYFAAVKNINNTLVMTGSRAVAVLGKADNLFEAEKIAENYAQQIHGPVFHRHDIGTEKLINYYVSMTDEF